MWVHRFRLAYTGRSSGGPDAMVAFIHIRDATLDMLAGATVEVEWTLDGNVLQPPAGNTVDTDEQGIAVSRLWAGRGLYEICVLEVTKEGWIWDHYLDREERCQVFTLP